MRTAALGIDVGSHRLALGCPRVGLSTSVDFENIYKGRRDEELAHLARWLERATSGFEHMVTPFVEKPFVSHGGASNPTTTISLAEVVGVIRSRPGWGGESVLIPPTTWKAQMVGKGNASKEEIGAWFDAQESGRRLRSPTEDEIDAWCIGLYGEKILSGELALPVPAKKKRRRKAPDEQPPGPA